MLGGTASSAVWPRMLFCLAPDVWERCVCSMFHWPIFSIGCYAMYAIKIFLIPRAAAVGSFRAHAVAYHINPLRRLVWLDVVEGWRNAPTFLRSLDFVLLQDQTSRTTSMLIRERNDHGLWLSLRKSIQIEQIAGNDRSQWPLSNLFVIIVPIVASSVCLSGPLEQPRRKPEDQTQLSNSLTDGVSKALPAKVRVGKLSVA